MTHQRNDTLLPEPTAPAAKRDVLASEAEYLIHHHLLSERDGYAVLRMQADHAPHLLYEVGRLREITFRGQGEGSRRGSDLDRFDLYYSHLVLWDKDQRQVAGAARLGRSDLIAARFGTEGLYASTLFDLKEGFLKHLHWPLEIGALFVAEGYRGRTKALPLLLRGLGDLLVHENPRRFIMGVVLLDPGLPSCLTPTLPPAVVEAFKGAHAFVRPKCFSKRKSLGLSLRHTRLGLQAISLGLDPWHGKKQAALVITDTALWRRSLLRRVAGREGMNRLALAGRHDLADSVAA